MADLREDFIQYVVKNLVSNPDAVQLQRKTDEKGEYLELSVDAADMGKVIGKAGATAKSIRTLLRGVGAKDDLAPLPLKIVDPEGSVRETPVQAETATPEVEAAEVPVAEAVDAEIAEPVPAEEVAPATTEEDDEHTKRMAQTKREMEELADLEF